MSCAGKTALVIDGAEGIGRAASLALASAGAQVLVHHCHAAAAARDVVTEIRSAGGKAEALATLIEDEAGIRALARKTRAIVGDRLDILVVNNVTLEIGAFEIAKAEMLDAELARNVRTPLVLVQQMLPILRAGSSIIFSLAGTNQGDAVGHASVRGAISGVVPHLAATLAERGIRVNAVMAGQLPATGSRTNATYDGLADAITFLASEGARLISGDTLSGQLI